jgi:hypothetical protein
MGETLMSNASIQMLINAGVRLVAGKAERGYRSDDESEPVIETGPGALNLDQLPSGIVDVKIVQPGL